MDQAPLLLDFSAELRLMPSEFVPQPVAVFGFLFTGQQVLLCRHFASGRLVPPGGPLGLGDTPAQGLRRWLYAATGLAPQVGALVYAERRPLGLSDGASPTSCLFFGLQRQEQGWGSELNWGAPTEPQWVALGQLSRGEMALGYDALRLAEALRPASGA